MGNRLIEIEDRIRQLRLSGMQVDDFWNYTTAGLFTTVVSDSGTVAAGDGDGGILVLTPSDGTIADNDEAYVRTTNKIATIKANANLYAAGFVQFTEAATNAANIFFGWASAIAANTLVDDGAGMLASFSGACIFKVDGSNVWKCISSNGATQTISVSTTTAGGSAYQMLEIKVDPIDSTTALISFWCNGKQLIDASTGRAITHRYTYTSAVAMYLGAGSKNGSANQQTLQIDAVAFAVGRAA